MYNGSFFPHRLGMSVSYPESGTNVPTYSRFGILLHLRRPLDADRRRAEAAALDAQIVRPGSASVESPGVTGIT